MKIVKESRKRRCPYCSSNKWEWIEAIPTSFDVIRQHLLAKYRCEKCGREFLVDEKAGVRYLEKVGQIYKIEQCYNCNSKNIEMISRDGAVAEIYRCKQCQGYLVIRVK